MLACSECSNPKSERPQRMPADVQCRAAAGGVTGGAAPRPQSPRLAAVGRDEAPPLHRDRADRYCPRLPSAPVERRNSCRTRVGHVSVSDRQNARMPPQALPCSHCSQRATETFARSFIERAAWDTVPREIPCRVGCRRLASRVPRRTDDRARSSLTPASLEHPAGCARWLCHRPCA